VRSARTARRMIPGHRAHAAFALWYTYSVTPKLDEERKSLGAAVPILTPDYLHGEMEVRWDHILRVWRLGQQLVSLLNWKMNRNVFASFSALRQLLRGCTRWCLAKPTKWTFHSQEKEASDVNLGRERGKIRRPHYISVPQLLSWTLLSI